MEKGSFIQDVSKLDFENSVAVDSIALPNELPIFDSSSAGIEKSEVLGTSGSLELLISQNEDLMARLKVTLRRLAILEDENRKYQKETLEIRQNFSSYTDQILIWKEKEGAWARKCNETEKKLLEIGESFKAYKDDSKKTEEEAEKFKKYYNKIHHHVKPYIQKLKRTAQSLVNEIEILKERSIEKEAHIHEIESQLMEVKTDLFGQIETLQNEQNQLLISFEREKNQFQEEKKNLLDVNESLLIRSQNYEVLLEKQDLLENENIALQRNNEELTQYYKDTLRLLRVEVRTLKQELQVVKEQKQQEQKQKEEKQEEKQENVIGQILDSTSTLEIS